MRILFCSTSYPPPINGQAIFTQNLVEGMADLGHDVLALVPLRNDSIPIEPKKGVQIIPTPAIHLEWIHPDFHLPAASDTFIQKVFRKFQPQIVHVQDSAPLCQAVMRKAQRQGIPIVVTHHPGPEITAPYFFFQLSFMKNFTKWGAWKYIVNYLNQADLVTVPSDYSTTMLKNHGVKTMIQTIPCGVQFESFHPDPGIDREAVRRHYGLDEGKILFLYVGRIDYEKNLDTLINGLALVDYPNIQLAIAGQGSEEHRLRLLADKLGLSESKVVFLGDIQHVSLPEILNSSDIFVMPGGAESFSIATLEAMACAKPILAANSAALPELVTHLVNGYLFRPDSSDEVKRGITFLIDNQKKWKDMGSFSLTKARNYSLTKMLSITEQVYQELL
ncbi:MAG: glycosyltransferase [Flexilinea sp.]